MACIYVEKTMLPFDMMMNLSVSKWTTLLKLRNETAFPTRTTLFFMMTMHHESDAEHGGNQRY